MTRRLLLPILTLLAAAGISLVADQAPSSSTPDKTSDKADKKERWDITQSLGPTKPLDFETDEATWMNVDVSPDGAADRLRPARRSVRDAGRRARGAGLAERLTSGPAFDMQPRFSPDGKSIAFASDRDGLWNIWVMARDGSGARQVSKEKRWFVNSPAWAPDSQYIFARHHFVKERSLGAGEIWMYHASGGEGLQVTEKNGWQKDAGEPATSPDGRYLYYSKDVTPGPTLRVRQGSVRHDLRDHPPRSRDRQGADGRSRGRADR